MKPDHLDDREIIKGVFAPARGRFARRRILPASFTARTRIFLSCCSVSNATGAAAARAIPSPAQV